MSDLLIEAETLRRTLTDPNRLVLDVRYNLTDAQLGERVYREGHIPGAHFLDQNTELAGPLTGDNGRHPLPDAQKLAELLQRIGLQPQSNVVVYDARDGSVAARAWWLLRWLGHSRVVILNGGWEAWLEAGGAQETSVNTPRPLSSQKARVPVAAMPTKDTTEILTRAPDSTMTLIDARAPERYHGKTEPIDPVAGRIHGALNRYATDNVETDGRFKSAAQLRAEFGALMGQSPASQVVHYCGSGIAACHNIFAMELAGLSGSALYPGSWSEWCSDPGRPVEKD